MRGRIRRRSKDSWTVVVGLPCDPETGKRRQCLMVTRGTKKDAERVLASPLVEVGGGLANLSSPLLAQQEGGA
jgi:hypothetical protein